MSSKSKPRQQGVRGHLVTTYFVIVREVRLAKYEDRKRLLLEFEVIF